MRSLRARQAAIVVALVSVLAWTSTPATLVAAPVGWERVDVLLDTTNESFDAVTLVTGTLPESVPLPAEVALMVPAGTEILWAGEILGGALEDDPEATYQIIPGSGVFDTVLFELTRSRIGQIEFDAPGKISRTGDEVSASVAWRTPGAAPTVRLGITVLTAARVTTSTPGVVASPGPSGKTYHVLELTDVAAGRDVGMRVSFVPPTGTGASGGGSTTGGSSAVVFPLIVIVILLITAGLFVVSRGRARHDASGEDSGEQGDLRAANPAEPL